MPSFSALEVALHERVGDLGDLVHELLAVLLRLGLELVGDRDLARVVASVAVVFVGLHVDEVHDAADLVQKVRAGAPYDLVFANILAPPLVALAQDIKRALKPGGIAILSGLLRTQERRVLAAYASRGFRLERRLHRDAWATLVLRRA